MILAYKAFNQDLTCTMGKGTFRYEPDKWYEEPKADCASTGFHCAANPLDCLSYYRDMDKARYWLVFADGDIDEDNYDSRISCTRIRLVQELDLKAFVRESISYMITHPRLTVNRLVRSGHGEAARQDRFVIVRGKDPVAKGEKGTILGFAREKPRGKDIDYANLLVVDGKHVMPGTWYNAEGKAVEAPKEAVK